jgi:hypothetical protein
MAAAVVDIAKHIDQSISINPARAEIISALASFVPPQTCQAHDPDNPLVINLL